MPKGPFRPHSSSNLISAPVPHGHRRLAEDEAGPRHVRIGGSVQHRVPVRVDAVAGRIDDGQVRLRQRVAPPQLVETADVGETFGNGQECDYLATANIARRSGYVN